MNGCVLADAMGLGKTYAALLASVDSMHRKRHDGELTTFTLVITTTTAMYQWEDEIKGHFDEVRIRQVFSVHEHVLKEFASMIGLAISCSLTRA